MNKPYADWNNAPLGVLSAGKTLDLAGVTTSGLKIITCAPIPNRLNTSAVPGFILDILATDVQATALADYTKCWQDYTQSFSAQRATEWSNNCLANYTYLDFKTAGMTDAQAVTAMNNFCAAANAEDSVRGKLIMKAIREVYPKASDQEVALANLKAGTLSVNGLTTCTFFKKVSSNPGRYNVLSSACTTAVLPLGPLEKALEEWKEIASCQKICSDVKTKAFQQYMTERKSQQATFLKNSFVDNCYGKLNETFTVTYTEKYYHFTLYEYNPTGSLIATTPPEGVDYIRQSDFDIRTSPSHRMKSTYAKNSIGELKQSASLDGGITSYVYDKAGRVRFSQNAEQKSRSNSTKTVFSYTKYDQETGRITETGEYNTAVIRSVSSSFEGSTPDKNQFVSPYTNSSAKFRTGAYSLPLTMSGTNLVSAPALEYPANAGDKVNAEIYAWDPRIDDIASLTLAYLNGSNTVISTSDVSASAYAQWQQLKFTNAIAPAGTVKVRVFANIKLRSGYTANTDIVYFDDLALSVESFSATGDLAGFSGVDNYANTFGWPGTGSWPTYFSYDRATLSGYSFDYTQNRVSRTANDNGATYYSYDAHGRVKMLVQEIKTGTGIYTYKTLHYAYNPVSSLITEVVYQKGVAGEEYRHRYTYDKDNRVSLTETSHNGGVLWDSVAAYKFYTHGPLKRTLLGKRIQGLDYVYTVQGWLKAINHPHTDRDPGADNNGSVGQDVFAEMINYYRGDYRRVIAGRTGTDNGWNYSTTPANSANILPNHNMTGTGDYRGKDLYNGNISSIVSRSAHVQAGNASAGGDLMLQRFEYDVLNRLKRSFAECTTFTASNTTGIWGTAAILNGATSKFSEELWYDMNGNIDSLTRRNSTGTLIDNLGYKYRAASSDPKFPIIDDPNYPGNTTKKRKLTNKLPYVDNGNTTGVNNDLPMVADQALGNYAYDDKGRMTKDDKNDIATITWTVYDKVETIIRKSGSTKPNLYYKYDAMGQRLSKLADYPTGNDNTTYYAYDASGNVMATYDVNVQPQEAYLYGSSRIGSFAYLDKTLPQTAANVNNTYAGMSTTQNLSGTSAASVASSVKAQVATGATYNGVLTLGTGSTLIIKGNCNLASGTNFGTNSTIAIEPGGSLTFSYSPTVNGTLTLVNRGTITCTGTLTHSNGLFYNLGTANIGVFSGAGGTFVNYNGGTLSLTSATASTLEGRFYSYGTLTKANGNALAYASGQEAAPRSATTFEVTDHLGNVRAVVTGVKTSGAATIVKLTDYYPFGSPMRLRNVGPTVYRYGFNGMESNSPDMESYTTEFRQYDPALGRWMSVDPVPHPWQSPYCSMDNNPIIIIDPDGKAGFLAWLKSLLNGMKKMGNSKANNVRKVSNTKLTSRKHPNLNMRQTAHLKNMRKVVLTFSVVDAISTTVSKNKVNHELDRRIYEDQSFYDQSKNQQTNTSFFGRYQSAYSNSGYEGKDGLKKVGNFTGKMLEYGGNGLSEIGGGLKVAGYNNVVQGTLGLDPVNVGLGASLIGAGGSIDMIGKASTFTGQLLQQNYVGSFKTAAPPIVGEITSRTLENKLNVPAPVSAAIGDAVEAGTSEVLDEVLPETEKK